MFYPVICYAHVMVPMIIVAYGHVKRLNILSVLNSRAQLVDSRRFRNRHGKNYYFFLFILILNIDTSNSDNCLHRVESSYHSRNMMEQQDLETYTLLKILSHCSNCRGHCDFGDKSMITSRAAQCTASFIQIAIYEKYF